MNTDDYTASRVELLNFLKAQNYDFVPPTPRTHRIVLERRGEDALGTSATDILGWSMPFDPDQADATLVAVLRAASALEEHGRHLRATVRVAKLGDDLFLHSAHPTEAQDAVFFGPDSYRFADLIRAALAGSAWAQPTVVDIGTGSGVGAIVGARSLSRGRSLGTDVNAEALNIARANAQAAGVALELVEADVLGNLPGPFDVVLANPPYIVDDDGRVYRDGGGLHGAELSLRMVEEALPRLAPGGMLILYTGTAITAGRDRLQEEAAGLAAAHGCRMAYRTIDPDVFGEELRRPAYDGVDRIAVIGAVFRR